MWEVIILLSSAVGAAALTWFTVLETNGSKLKKENITLYGEITNKTDDPDYLKNEIENTEKLKNQSEGTLKETEDKIANNELNADEEATKKVLKANKENITKHQTKLNYLKTIQDKGLNGINWSLTNILYSGGTFLISFLVLNFLLKQLLKIVKPAKDE